MPGAANANHGSGETGMTDVLHCSFCGKSQHEVEQLSLAGQLACNCCCRCGELWFPTPRIEFGCRCRSSRRPCPWLPREKRQPQVVGLQSYQGNSHVS